MARRRILILAAAVATTLLSASAASAGTVEVVDGTVVFTGSPGETNDVRAGTGVLGPPLRLGIIDSGAPLTVGAGCAALDPNTAVCGDETTYETLPMAIRTRDGADRVFFEDVLGDRELTVRVGGGDDSVRVGAATGFDPTVFGGPGDDTLTANMNIAGTPVLRGGPGDDALSNIGGAGALLYGDDGDDRLHCLCTAFSRDPASYRLDGGADDDTYTFTWFLDEATRRTATAIVPSTGFDTLDRSNADGSFGSATSFDFSSCPRCVEQVIGSVVADQLTGDDRSQVIRAGAGEDVLVGGDGWDTLLGEDGDDQIDARDGGIDIVLCGAGTDSVLADRQDKVAGDCENVTRTRF